MSDTVNKATRDVFEEAFYSMKKTPAFSEYIHWQELKERTLILNDQVDDLLVEDIVMPILKWNKEDEKAEEELGLLGVLGDTFVRKPVTLYMNCPGGDIFVGLIVAEVIRKSKTPVHIIVLSMAASMGSVILAAGHKRSAYKYSNILVHDGSTGIAGTSNKVRDHMKYLEQKNKQIKGFIIANSKITEEQYASKEDREWWMTADEALELGMIDEIIEG